VTKLVEGIIDVCKTRVRTSPHPL